VDLIATLTLNNSFQNAILSVKLYMIMLSVVMLSVVMLSAIKLNVVMLSVVASLEYRNALYLKGLARVG